MEGTATDETSSTDGEPASEGEARAGGPSPYRAVFEAAPDGILLVDEDGTICELNPRAEEMFGYAGEELVGRNVDVLVPEASRPRHRRERRAYVEDPHARPMGVGLELKGRRKDGSHFPVEISLSPLEAEGELRVVTIVRDVTERKRLRDFTAGALRAAEDERRRIARDLHDDTAQRLAGLLIRLRLARKAEEQARRDELLEQARQEILEAAESVRRIARGLRPPALQDAGLVTALRWQVRSQVEPTDLSVETRLQDGVDALLDEDDRLVLYRVVQEALTNVVRHAEASRVRIELGAGQDGVWAEVTDDGVGFQPGRARGDGVGLGLLGMRERAHLVGGRLEVRSEPDEGTRVRLELPARRDEEDDG